MEHVPHNIVFAAYATQHGDYSYGELNCFCFCV
jgi:hypothetical protein